LWVFQWECSSRTSPDVQKEVLLELGNWLETLKVKNRADDDQTITIQPPKFGKDQPTSKYAIVLKLTGFSLDTQQSTTITCTPDYSIHRFFSNFIYTGKIWYITRVIKHRIQI